MPCILLIDDEESLRHLIALQLSMLGHTVIEAGDGDEALELIATQTVSLVVSDVNLPGRNGFEMITEFRKTRPGLRFIIMSGSGSQDRIMAQAAAHTDICVLMKPFEMKSLREAVDAALEPPANRSDGSRDRQAN